MVQQYQQKDIKKPAVDYSFDILDNVSQRILQSGALFMI
jgi:hypothetical protein